MGRRLDVEVRAIAPLPPKFFARVSDLGVAAQAAIPGFYAWSVTVAPAAWARGAPMAAKVGALLGAGCLGAAIALERRHATWSRAVSVWGLVLTSALVWALVPGALSPARLEASRGVAGMIGWALFAFASAAPALKRGDSRDLLVAGAPLRPRARIPRGDAIFIAGGVLFSLLLQTIGWQAVVPERALLVRLVALASGLAVLGAMTSIALARHGRRATAKRKLRMRRASRWLAVLALLLAVGIVAFGVFGR